MEGVIAKVRKSFGNDFFSWGFKVDFFSWTTKGQPKINEKWEKICIGCHELESKCWDFFLL